MRRVVLLPALAAFLCLAVPVGVGAQEPPPDGYQAAPAHVSIVDGRATLEREGRTDSSPLNVPLLSGDRLRTDNGRLEVLFGDGSTLDLDASSVLDVQSDSLVRLIDGRLRLAINTPGTNYRVDSPAGSVRIAQPGEYRLALLHGDASTSLGAGETQLELAVLRGSATIFTDQGSTDLGAGQRAYASAGLAPSYAYAYNSAEWDAFDAWSEAQRSERLGASQSAQYLPADIQTYAPMLDQYGGWQYNAPYGYVWYPRVASGWRPYYYGRWASYPRYGWTWIGTERWAWPTHHYGRWGFSAGAWFWIPGSYWSPAYVSWAYAPGYVSWCPLGWDNRSVFGISVGFGFGSRYYSPWDGWTVVPRGYFGRGYGYAHAYVHQRAEHWGAGGRGGRGGHPPFQVRPGAPSGPDIAVPRRAYAAAAAPVIGPSRGMPGGPRGPMTPGSSVPRYVNNGDQIIRSQTGRPRAPQAAAPAPFGRAAVSRGAPVNPTVPSAGAIQRGYGAGTGRTVPVRPGMPADGGRRAIDRPSTGPQGAPSRVEGRGRPGGYSTAPSMPGSFEGSPRYTAPTSRPYGAPSARPYDAPRGYYSAPGARPAPMSPGPSSAPRYERPTYGSRPMPGPQAMPRSAPRGGAVSAPPPSRSAGAPAGRPASGGGGRPAPRGGRGR